MFNFFDMVDNYEERLVANFKKDDLVVDTCAVTDSAQPYETGITHPKYNQGRWIIVELYDTKNEAKKGHNKWVALMTANTLPPELKDASSAGIAELRDSFNNDEWRTFKRMD